MEIPVLGELETAVLEWLWEHGTAETRDIQRTLGEARGITLSTIQSTVERLHRKQLLMRERFGHAYRYAPALTRAEFRAKSIAGLAGDLEGADAAGVLAAFVDIVARTDRSKLDELASLVEAARARQVKTRRGRA